MLFLLLNMAMRGIERRPKEEGTIEELVIFIEWAHNTTASIMPMNICHTQKQRQSVDTYKTIKKKSNYNRCKLLGIELCFLVQEVMLDVGMLVNVRPKLQNSDHRLNPQSQFPIPRVTPPCRYLLMSYFKLGFECLYLSYLSLRLFVILVSRNL